jgi:cytoskeleton protein RodZ
MIEQGASAPVVQTSIRQAREARGLSLESLAATLKVSPAKLDALESGRFTELPDLAFARALAKTVCRQLGIDPATVLSGLPSVQPVDLSASDQRGVPFKASKARLNLDAAGSLPWGDMLKAKWLVPLGILAAALTLHFWPQQTPWLDAQLKAWTDPAADVTSAASAPVLPDDLLKRNAQAPEVASSQLTEAVAPVLPPASLAAGVTDASASAPVSASAPAVATSSVAPAAPNGAANAAASAPTGHGLQMVMSGSSWIEVRSQPSGEKVLFRQVNAGEVVQLDASAPLNVKIGNAAAVKLTYRGQPIELDAFTRNNVARLELK